MVTQNTMTQQQCIPHFSKNNNKNAQKLYLGEKGSCVTGRREKKKEDINYKAQVIQT